MKQYLLPILAILIAIVALGLGLRSPKVPFGGGVNGATFGESNASCSTVTLNATSTKIISSDGRRSYWSVSDLGTSSVVLSFTNPAISNAGIVLNPMSSSSNTFYRMDYPSIDSGNIYALASASGTAIGICTGNSQ